MLADLRYTARTLRRSPGFTIGAVLALALGIGANTAVFSVVYAVLLKPLPYPEPDRLVRLYEDNPDLGVHDGDVSPASVLAWRTSTHTLDAVALCTPRQWFVSFGDDDYQIIHMAAVSPAFFPALGVSPILGRTFPLDESVSPADGVREVVIGEGLWRRRFGGRAEAIGRLVHVESRIPFRIVGVMPAWFDFPQSTEAWTAETFTQSLPAGQREGRWRQAIGRMAQSATLADTRAELAVISSRLGREFADSHAGWHARVDPLRVAMAAGRRTLLLILFGAAVCVLLISCTNVAHLLLARAAARRHENAVRAALGASRAHLVRQALADAIVLVTLAACAGGLASGFIAETFWRLAPERLGLTMGDAVPGVTWLFVLAAGATSAAIAAVLPAVRVGRTDPQQALASQSRGSSTTGRWSRSALIGAETALALMLLVAGLLLIRSFVALREIDLGFTSARVLTIDTRLPIGRIPPGRGRWFALQQKDARLLDAVRAVPGVEAAGLVTDLPLTGDAAEMTLWRADAPANGRQRLPASVRDQLHAHVSIVSPGYFETIGVPLIQGRGFTQDDRFSLQQLAVGGDAQSMGVAVINAAAARRYFAGENPIGHRIAGDLMFASGRTIVGVVGDVRSSSVAAPAAPAVFLPEAQHPDVLRPSIVVRSSMEPVTLTRSIEAAIRRAYPELIVMRARPLGEIVTAALSTPRFNLLLIGSFGLVALVLAAMGVYSVAAYAVVQRTREVGIRMALGARRADVLGLIVRDGMWPIAAGATVGLVASALAVRTLQSLLFGVAPLDPVSFVGAPTLLVAVALLACYLPARRAARIDPLVALRDE